MSKTIELLYDDETHARIAAQIKKSGLTPTKFFGEAFALYITLTDVEKNGGELMARQRKNGPFEPFRILPQRR